MTHVKRRFGIPPATAREQLQKNHAPVAQTQSFQPLPAPTGQAPFRLELASVLGSEPQSLSLHVIGDHARRPVSSCWSVGDIVYFNGAEVESPSQFGEPYAHYNVPLFAIPGNHDGDPLPGEASLAAFMRNFCAAQSQLLASMAEYQRDTMTQPNCYWTLRSAHATIVGLYSNVPEGGEIRAPQIEWLTGELEGAPQGVPLIVALHHPPYSADTHHGGSERMGKVLDEALQKARRVPQLILTGHVHNYQRFSRSLPAAFIGDNVARQLPYIVIGNSGYHNLHALATGAAAGEELAPGVKLESFCADRWGFLRLDVGQGADPGKLHGDRPRRKGDAGPRHVQHPRLSHGHFSSGRLPLFTPKRSRRAGTARSPGARIGGRGEIAQLVEHATENRGVGGSSPPLAIRKSAANERVLR
jgi:hypothetical protein